MWFHLRVSRILFAASQTWLDNIAHEQTIIILYAVICMSLFCKFVIENIGGFINFSYEPLFSLTDKIRLKSSTL